VFADAGIDVLRSPPRAPRANAFAAWWVCTIRRECLDGMLIFHERQLLRVLAEYAGHYNMHRPHRALEQLPPIADVGHWSCRRHRSRPAVRGQSKVPADPGGLINEYRHAV
jgi:putative transposase